MDRKVAADWSQIGAFLVGVAAFVYMVWTRASPSTQSPAEPTTGGASMTTWIAPGVLAACILLAAIFQLIAARTTKSNREPKGPIASVLPQGQLVLMHAEYGVEPGQADTMDVTSILNSMVVNGRLTLKGGEGSYNALFRHDPKKFVHKKLKIDYTYGGEVVSITVPEDKKITLPCE